MWKRKSDGKTVDRILSHENGAVTVEIDGEAQHVAEHVFFSEWEEATAETVTEAEQGEQAAPADADATATEPDA